MTSRWYRKQSETLLLAASSLWICAASFIVWRYTFDDSYIIFRYAQNIAKGLGVVYNVGQRVEGCTSFLWVVVLAGAAKLGADVFFAAKVLGVLLNLVALAGVCWLCRLISSPQAPLYGAAVLLAATNTHFINGSVGGLESPLFTAILCWSLFAYLKALRAAAANTQRKWCAVAAVLFALLVMTRPDGALIYAVVLFHAAWKFRRQLGAVAAITLPFILLYAPYFAWRWHYFGYFLPNTFYVKRGGTGALFTRGVTETGKFLGLEAGGWFLSGLVGLAVIWFPVTETTVLALVIGARIFFEVWSGGVSPGEYHFLIPALPLFWILAERILWAGCGTLERRGGALAAGVTTLLVAVQIANFFAFRKHRIQPEVEGMARAHIALGKWLNASTLPGAAVAVGDIGAIGMWSQRRILDLDGLTDTHIAHLPGAYAEKRDSPYVLGQAPEFIVLRTTNCRPEESDVLFGMDKAIYSDPQFHRDYAETNCWEVWARYDLLVYQRRAGARHAGSGSP